MLPQTKNSDVSYMAYITSDKVNLNYIAQSCSLISGIRDYY